MNWAWAGKDQREGGRSGLALVYSYRPRGILQGLIEGVYDLKRVRTRGQCGTGGVSGVDKKLDYLLALLV